jgi:DNA invertase Pin-like site-specific DNA recombinase
VWASESVEATHRRIDMSPSRKNDKPLAIYTRVSNQGNRSDDELLSHDLQEKRIREYAAAKGLKVSAVRFEDTDVSGGRMKRKGLDAALEAVKSGEYGGVIVARMTRFARSLEGGLRVIRQINKMKGEFVACDAELDTTTAMGRTFLQFALMVAELELETIKGYAEEVRREKVEHGHYVSGAPPAGYSKEVVGTRKDGRPIYGKLVPNEHAHGVLGAFKLRAGGASWKEVAQHLTDSGVPTSRGNTRWSSIGAAQMIRNRAYLGEIRNGGVRKHDEDGDEYVTDEHVNGAAHDPLPGLTLSIFEAAQVRQTRSVVETEEREDALLRGVVRCGTCGRAMVRDWLGGGDRKRMEFYRCKNAGACEQHVVISRGKLDPYVTGLALAHLGEVEFEAWDVDARGRDVAALETEVREAEVELVDLTERLVAGTVTAATAVSLSTALEARVAKAREALREIPVYSILDDSAYAYRYKTEDEVRETFDRMTAKDKRRFIGLLVENVAVKPGKGTVEERATVKLRDLDRARQGLVVPVRDDGGSEPFPAYVEDES